GPDHERLTAAHVTRGKDLRHRGAVAFGISSHIAAWILGRAELLQQPSVNWTDETHRQEHEVRFHFELAAWQLAHDRLTVRIFLPRDAGSNEFLHLPLRAFKALRSHSPIALASLFVGARAAQLDRPIRPHEWFIFLVRRCRQELELRN